MVAGGRRKVLTVVVVLVCLVPGVCYMGVMRAQSYGVDVRVLLWELWMGALFAGLVTLSCLLLGRRLRQAIAIGCIGLLASIVVAETWFGFEEVVFRREVARIGTTRTHSRPRWYPFGSSGLIYHKGRFSAHD